MERPIPESNSDSHGSVSRAGAAQSARWEGTLGDEGDTASMMSDSPNLTKDEYDMQAWISIVIHDSATARTDFAALLEEVRSGLQRCVEFRQLLAATLRLAFLGQRCSLHHQVCEDYIRAERFVVSIERYWSSGRVGVVIIAAR
jgi:hypothetical protein